MNNDPAASKSRASKRRARIRNAEGALDALVEGLELHGLRLPSLGMDLVALTTESERPPLITLGSVPADTAHALGKAPLLAHAAAARAPERP